ncbi:hypothetical protein BN1723_012665 [Verticillium longisporum]|uniref:Uncharacterized protein n=1 Tax=Verticillium longisporum TaxID=100787 RepID=A0A0G4LJX8_VERLO|nr:hypothetical protein BN1723_012665 [Verticillium longisporum]
MATATDQQAAPTRAESPSPEIDPTPAIGAYPELSRCLSTASDLSHGSGTEFAPRDSLGSMGSDAFSRQSSASYGRRSDSRESVMSLGSIAHVQHYFARTGLLDGKGGQLQRKNRKLRGTLDLSSLDAANLSPPLFASDSDSSYASMGSSPDLAASSFTAGPMVESPIDDGYYSDEFEDGDPNMLPPTASTYINREKPVPKPPSIAELKLSLTSSLEKAAVSLKEARARQDSAEEQGHPFAETPTIEIRNPAGGHTRQKSSKTHGWFEIQGMHILDVMTLAIRAAKMYYTAHEQPERLDAIKPERQIRADIFSVMETLKQMATRRWAGGMRDEELDILDRWIQGLFAMLQQEHDMEEAERAEQATWTWLHGDWAGKEVERELSFMASLEVGLGLGPLPEYTPSTGLASGDLPTPFLRSMQNGLRLVKLHNAAVKKSKRRFGGITTFHEDTEKPYRCADNLRYWIKAAELRWEVPLKIDALGIVYNSSPDVWIGLETAIWAWCKRVREEISTELAS